MLVVGGGVAGLAAAAMCRRAGIPRVTLVERERLACGASGAAAGGLTPDVHALGRPPAFVDLARAGLALHRELDAEWDGALGLRRVDWLIALGAAPPRYAVEAIEGAAWLDAAAARALEPQIGEVAGAVVLPGQAQVHPLRLAAALARRAGQVATGVRMTGLEAAGGRVAHVRTTAGEVSPGALVLATGLAPAPWVEAPQRAVKGHLIATAPAPFRLRAAVASAILVLQLADGRLLAGGTFDEGDEEDAVREEVVAGIVAELGRLVPAAAALPVERRWCCFRPATGDELPIVDRVPGLDNAWVTAGHFRTGLLVAPAAGRALASWIATGERPPELAAFGLDRFG